MCVSYICVRELHSRVSYTGVTFTRQLHVSCINAAVGSVSSRTSPPHSTVVLLAPGVQPRCHSGARWKEAAAAAAAAAAAGEEEEEEESSGFSVEG